MNELSDPFVMNEGTRVTSASGWDRRRSELQDLVVALQYGKPPLASKAIVGEELHHHEIERFGGARHAQHRLHAGPAAGITFVLDMLIPVGDGARPVILEGDGCWRSLTDEIIGAVLGRGYVLAQFNRVEMAPDVYTSNRDSGIYPLFAGAVFGAIAAWAWGFHRCVDFLLTQDCVVPSQIAVTGHSRGGKAALLAGATDPRIALTAPNGSGCGGAGCYRILGPGSETLSDILGPVPYWFHPGLKAFIGREAELPFDQHYLKALVAPRALLSTEALDDLWANPMGTWQTHAAAREVYRFLGAEERVGIHFRHGGHDHALADWEALLDFADWHLKGLPRRRAFGTNPFPDAPRGFLWRAPPS